MVLFKSPHQDIEDIPENLTIWDWLFENKETSPLRRKSDGPLGAFIDAESKERLDWAQVKSKSTLLSTCLIEEYDLQPGDTVTSFSNNTIWYPVCMLAVLRAGGRVNGAPIAYTIDEMVYALKIANTKIVIAVPSAIENAARAAELVGIPPNKVFLSHGAVPGFKTIQELMERGETMTVPLPYQLPSNTTSKDLCGFLNFSSGTTGLPKAVMLSHYNVIAQCYIAVKIQVDPHKVKYLAILPLYHVTGTWRFCLFSIFMNGDAIMLPTYSLAAMLQATVYFKVEELTLVPPILLKLARDPIVDRYDLSHIKRLNTGAAPVSPEVLKSLQQRFPWTGFRQGYGATEAPVMAGHPPMHNSWKYGKAVGMLLPNTVAKIIDPEGNELNVNQPGELFVKGPQTAMGYLDNIDATETSFDRDGFYHTGDAAYFDEEGFIFITDRIKEMIKVKGHQVPPAELEDLLLGHEFIDDCAVVGIPDEYSGELPKGYVVLKSGVPETLETVQTLLKYVRNRKVKYKWIAEIEFIDKIPKSPAGKILRRVLRDRKMGPIKIPEPRQLKLEAQVAIKEQQPSPLCV